MHLTTILFGILLLPLTHTLKIKNVEGYYNCAESENTICTKIAIAEIDGTNYNCYRDVVTGEKVCTSSNEKHKSLIPFKKGSDDVQNDCYEDLASGEKECLSGDKLPKRILTEQKHIDVDDDASYDCRYFKNMCTKIKSLELSQKNSDCRTDTIKIDRVNGQEVEGWILPGHHNKLLLSKPERSYCKMIRR